MSEKIVAYDLLITCPDDVTEMLSEIEKQFLSLIGFMEGKIK